jgi:DNA-binding CsgD family transcriptional regulator
MNPPPVGSVPRMRRPKSPVADPPVAGAAREEPGAPLEAVLSDALAHRPWREPDYKSENLALVGLARSLSESPQRILQMLAEAILDVTDADSAGLSLLTVIDGETRFYWPAIAGVWKPHVGGGTPRDFGPCGDVLDANGPLLFCHLERRYTYFRPVMPPAVECLLVPFAAGSKPVGTIWALAHDERRKFDAEDLRLMQSLGQFASAAYEVLRRLGDIVVPVPGEASEGVEPLHVKLSPRERECITLLVAGHTYRETARRLSVTTKTVETYRRRLMKKLGLRNRADLVSFAARNGLLHAGPVSAAD